MSEENTDRYLGYTFFRIRPEWRGLPARERAEAKDAFAGVIDEFTPRFDYLGTYSMTGVHPEVDFFFWKITERFEDLGELGAALNATSLAQYLETPYSYFATTWPSELSRRPAHIRRITPQKQKYFITYPWVRERSWPYIPLEKRDAMMDEETRAIGEFGKTITKHPKGYSFGIDNQDHMAMFECDNPTDFMFLTARLRGLEIGNHFERETPIFVGQLMDVRAALNRLDGVGSVSSA